MDIRTGHGHQDRCREVIAQTMKTLYKQSVEYCCSSLLSSLVNTQLMFLLDIPTERFTCSTAIGLCVQWLPQQQNLTGNHNSILPTIYIKSSWSVLRLLYAYPNVHILSSCLLLIHHMSSSRLSQTSFSLYLHNQWTDFHKLNCAGKPQMRAIRTYMGGTKATTNN